MSRRAIVSTASRPFIAGVCILMLFVLELAVAVEIRGIDSYTAFVSGDNGQGGAHAAIIVQCVAEGNGFLAKSYSGFLLFLNRIELGEKGGLDYEEAGKDLDRAVRDLLSAGSAFRRLTQIAAETPYDPSVLDRLARFDYESFQRENRLIGPIFDRVRYYLGKGDILGLYKEEAANIDKILEIAAEVNASMESKRFPDALILYSLNQACSSSLLFVQYTTSVFAEIE